jgi:hypothetical protein
MTKEAWPFDQGPRTATLTTRQVLDGTEPIRSVVHYDDDHSWAFTCGTTNNTADLRLVGMEEVLKIDDALRSIANLEPGWTAWRKNLGEPWELTRR